MPIDRITTLSGFLDEDPNDAFSRYALALEFVKTGNDNQASIHFEKLFSEQPGYLAAYYHYGKLLERKGDFIQAGTVFKLGMGIALVSGDRHTYNELQEAFDQLPEN